MILGINNDRKLYTKRNDSFKIELAIEPWGLYIHRSGEYYYELGLLIEALGRITGSITIEDQYFFHHHGHSRECAALFF